MGWFNSVASSIKHAAEDVGHAVKEGADDVAKGVTEGADAVAHTATTAADAVAKETTTIVDAAGDEAKSLASTLADAGITATDSVYNGAKWAGSTLEEGAEDVGEGLVEAGKFISDHACSIAVGTALGTAVAAISADGEEEGAMAALALAVKAGEIAGMQTAATAIAVGVTDTVWDIPGVSSGSVSKSTMTSVIKYTIMMAIKENASEVELTAGQYAIGALLTVLTGLICTGEVPGGFNAWEKAGESFEV